MDILFLAHRIPYPPNRGDKIRSWHILRHLAALAPVHLACFADDEADAAHLPALRAALGGALGEAHVEVRRTGKLVGGMQALASGKPASLTLFESARLRRFVEGMLANRDVGAIFAFSGQMGQFVPASRRARFVMDFGDVDSAKFAGYAAAGGVLAPLYRREAARLGAFERQTAARADLSLFVSEAEAALFRSLGATGDIRALPNGVDLAFYDPGADFPRLDEPGPLLVFTGQMDYPPNVEAVTAFARDVLLRLRRERPEVRFAIVGREPAPEVVRLAEAPGVTVTGEVADVRPWLAAAAAVVAPLQLARGIQNKVLEAMAMARPVVASAAAFTGIDAEPGRELLVADGAEAQARAALGLLADPVRAEAIGAAARRRVESAYSWEAKLAPLAAMIGFEPAEAAA